MPFDKAFDDIYKLGIQAVALEQGVIAQRVDEQKFSETMLERIYRQIDLADFIIADMTGKNPNVFYEVGYAHAQDKLCTLLTQDVNDIPFDLQHHRHIIYNGSIQTLKSMLAEDIKWLKSEREKQKTSPITVELKTGLSYLDKNDWRAQGIVNLEIDLHNRTLKKSPEIEAIYLHTGTGWKFTQLGDECSSISSETGKEELRHFITKPLSRLSPGAWGNIKLTGKKTLATTFTGDELKDSYTVSGYIVIDIHTTEGVVSTEKNVTFELDAVPF